MVEIEVCVRLSYLGSHTKVFKRFVTETLLALKVIGRVLNRLTLRRLMSYIYGAPILDVSRSHTTTQHSR